MRPLSRRRALQLGGLGVAGTVVGGTGLAWAGTARYTRTGRKRTLAGRSPMLGVPTAFPGVVAVAAGGSAGWVSSRPGRDEL